MARSCLFCFPDIVYIFSCLSIISSSLPLWFGIILLPHLPVSSLTSPRLIFPMAARRTLKKSKSDHVPALITLWLLSIHSRMCLLRLERLKDPHYSWGQPDSLASPPTFCQFPTPPISPKCYPPAIFMIIFWACCLMSVIFHMFFLDLEMPSLSANPTNSS